MKKFALLLIILGFALSSCGTIPKNYKELSGNTYGVLSPRDIIIYERPTVNSPMFRLSEAETFTTGKVVCAEELKKLKCYVDLLGAYDRPDQARSGFYKVKFASGEEGYISARYIYPYVASSLVSEEAARRRGVTIKEYMASSLDGSKAGLKPGKEELKRRKAISGASWPEDEKRRVLAHEAWIGMTDLQLRLSKDLPAKIKRKVGVKGIYSKWFYKDAVYTIKRGKVTGWKRR